MEAAEPKAGDGVETSTYRPTRRDLKQLVELAVPVAVAQVGLMAMGVVDTLMVGRVSAVDLAAVAVGHLYFFGVSIFGMGVLFALDPVVSQAVGAGDEVGVARGVQRGLILACLLTVTASVLLWPVGPVLSALRQPAEVVPIAASYTRVLILGVLPFYGFEVLRRSLQAMGSVGQIVFTTLVANLVNALLNWLLIFGNLGAPRLGAIGSGWATALSRWFMLLCLLTVAWRVLRPTLTPPRREAVARRPMVRMLRVGVPIGGQLWLEYGGFAAAGLLMGWLGAVALASHQIALQLAAFTFMVPLGVSQAVSVLVGRAVGQSDPPAARRATGGALLVGVGFMTLTAAVFLLLPGTIARLFTTDRDVLAVTAVLLPIAGLFQVFDGAQVVAAGALRGVGDTRVPMVLNLIGFWAIGLPLSVWLGLGLDLGPKGVWWGLAIGLAAVSGLLLRRVSIRFRRTLERLAIDDDAPGP